MFLKSSVSNGFIEIEVASTCISQKTEISEYMQVDKY